MRLRDLFRRRPTIERLKAKGDIDGLIALLEKMGNPSVRSHAANALGELRADAAIAALAARQSDQNEGVQGAAVRALRDIGGVRVMKALLSFTENRSWHVPVASLAVKALVVVGESAEEPLIRIFRKKGRERERKAAAEALGEIGGDRAYDVLRRRKDHDEQVEQARREALEHLKWRRKKAAAARREKAAASRSARPARKRATKKKIEKKKAPAPERTVLEVSATIAEASGPGEAASADATVFDAPPDRTVLSADEIAAAEEQVAVDWNEGDVILDLYEVKGLLGEGGMGKVYRVHHRGWNLDLAVKSPRAEFFQTEAQKANFVQECETWIELGLHPNTVSCHYVRTLGRVPRVFAEYVEGGSLSDWIKDRRLHEGGPEKALERILDVAIQFAWGLQYAHEKGLVHQDVKPANVMMTTDGTAKVTDFGLAQAKPMAEAQVPDGRGGTVLVKGRGMTPAYCSPEQAAGEELSRKTDIWSWGVSVMEMFTGEATWMSGQAAAEVLEAYLEARPEESGLPSMPDGLSELLRECFKPDPVQRPTDMGAVLARLRALYDRVTGEEYERPEPKPADLLADGLNNRAVSLLDLGRNKEAEELFDEALRSDPHNPEATHNRGLVLWRSGRLTDDAVVKLLEEVRTSHTDDWRDEYHLGLVHMERGDAEAALEVLEEAAARAPEEAEVRSALTVAEGGRGNWRSCVRVLKGHDLGVDSLAVTPDGRCVLTADTKGTLRLWNMATGKCVRINEGDRSHVESVTISPDGRQALSGDAEGTLTLWDVATRECIRVSEGHDHSVHSVAISPDGRTGFSGSSDKTLRLWDLIAGKCIRVFEGHDSSVKSVAISSDGRTGISGSIDRTLRFWELGTGECVRVFHCPTDVKSVAISPDGQWALSASDKTLRRWELSTGRCVELCQGHTNYVGSVSINADGQWALSGSADKTLRLWELSTGRCVRVFEGYEWAVRSATISPDGRWGIAGDQDTLAQRDPIETLRVWRLRASVPAAPFVVTKPRSAVRIGQIGSQAAGSICKARALLRRGAAHEAAKAVAGARRLPGYEKNPELLDILRKAGLKGRRHGLSHGWCARSLVGHDTSAVCVAISAEGRWAISGSIDKTLRLWELASGECVRVFEHHGSSVTSVAISPDGRWAVSSGGFLDKKMRLWELGTGECVRVFHGHTGGVESVAISPNGQQALSAGKHCALRLWELGTGKQMRLFRGHGFVVGSVAIGPDGRWAVSASQDKTVRLWDLAKGSCVRVFEGHGASVLCVAASPDGRWAFSGGMGKRLRLWELASGECVRVFEGHTKHIWSVAFCPDNRWAVSASADETVRLWDLAKGSCVRVFEGHGDSIESVATSPDGRWALSASGDKTLRLWELVWDYEFPEPADWDEGARPYLETFLSLRCPYGDDGISRVGKPTWNDDDFKKLLSDLQHRGYGWLRPEGVRQELEKMTREWKGPPPLPGA